ncbi:hypothetical protein ACJX0J_028862, partial [Zea mays]
IGMQANTQSIDRPGECRLSFTDLEKTKDNYFKDLVLFSTWLVQHEQDCARILTLRKGKGVRYLPGRGRPQERERERERERQECAMTLNKY